MWEPNSILKLVGLKIVAIKGYPSNKELKKKNPKIPVEYILFDDGETYIVLSEQDYYDYHDCSSSARLLSVYRNKEYYSKLMTYPDSNTQNF